MSKETERVIDVMYESWIKYSGQEQNQNQRKHPSREVYGELLKHAQLWIKHAQLWNLTAEAVLKQMEQTDGGQA